MNEFLVAIRTGMDAAQVAQQEHAEIKGVLRRLEESLESATSGTVTIKIIKRALNSDNELLQTFAFFFAKEKYSAIVLKGLKHSPSKIIEIARWRQDSLGYPCKITVGMDEYVCTDAESLTSVLTKIIVTSTVGLAIADIVKDQAKLASVGSKTPAGSTHTKNQFKSVANEVVVRSALGRVIEKPFVGKTIRVVAKKKTSGVPAKPALRTTAGKVTVRASASSPKVSEKSLKQSSRTNSTGALKTPLSRQSALNQRVVAAKPAARTTAGKVTVRASASSPKVSEKSVKRLSRTNFTDALSMHLANQSALSQPAAKKARLVKPAPKKNVDRKPIAKKTTGGARPSTNPKLVVK